LTYVARRLREPVLSGIRASDLYLACACLEGEPWAVEAVGRILTTEVEVALRQFDGAYDLLNEVRQMLRHKLLVSDGGAQPKLAEYAGRGDLRAWTRSVTVRTALNRLRDDRRGEQLDDEMGEALVSPAESPELALIKSRYRAAFRAAFGSALAGLSKRERTVLRIHYFDGLTLEEVGAVFGVHRATAARWLASAREKLLLAVRRDLADRLGMGPEELDSLLRTVWSQLDVSMRWFAD
jgi:RNA polymerase sigma-70 factor (ECF subfamily)